LVGSIRECRARSPTVRISVRRPEQKRSCATNTAGCSEKSDQSLLREKHGFRYSTTMQLVRGFSDHPNPVEIVGRATKMALVTEMLNGYAILCLKDDLNLVTLRACN